MVSHVLKIDPTYPKQVREEEEELETRVVVSVIDYHMDCVIDYTVQQPKIVISRPGETTLAQARILQYSPGFHPPRGKANSTFGGKVIVFCGDFRQILLVIPRGSRSNIINVAINSSYIWDNVRNMSLRSTINNTNHLQIQQFSKWILDVGDGNLPEPNDGYALIEIP
ncbi:hypothetical protein Lal_00039505 [Lupinus albus]|nr:hypothetical protein Lal_00039505 [Lupinus albus]